MTYTAVIEAPLAWPPPEQYDAIRTCGHRHKKVEMAMMCKRKMKMEQVHDELGRRIP